MTQPAARPRGFRALLAAVEAIEQLQPDKLNEALASVSTSRFVRVAARHRCVGYVYRGVLESKSRSEAARSFLSAARAYRAKAAFQAFAIRPQLRELIAILDAAGVPFVLLKGAARLFRGDVEAEWNMMGDLDLLIPRSAAGEAIGVLIKRGYRPSDGGSSAEHYMAHHHHLVPLLSPVPGLSVELHVELAIPGTLSLATDWDACRPFVEGVESQGVRALCFDQFGSALHLCVHGLGLRRLHDAVMLAHHLRHTPALFETLSKTIAAERIQPIALRGVLALGARIAGLEVPADASVDRYVAWIVQREELPSYLRERCQFVEAWHGNGGRLWGPSTRHALPEVDPSTGGAVRPVLFACRLLGRVATSAYAAAAFARSQRQPQQ